LRIAKELSEFFSDYQDGLSSIVGSANIGILVADINGHVVFANDKFCGLTGFALEEMIGKRIYEIFFPPDTPERTRNSSLMQARYKLRIQGRSEVYQTNIFRKNGERAWLETRAAPLFDTSGKVIGSIGLSYELNTGESTRSGTGEEITSSMASDDVLFEARKSNPMSAGLAGFVAKHRPGFASIVESLNEAMVIAENGFLWFANPRFSEITGYSQEDIQGKRLHEIYFPAGSPESIEEEKRIQSFYQNRLKGLSDTYDTHIICKNGERKWVETKASPLKDESGNIVCSVATIADITERKNLEEQLRWSQKMEAVGRLAGGLAHDFNNLLTVIQGYGLDLQNQLETTPDQQKKASVIVEASEAASALTQQLLSISRRQVTQMAPVELNQVVERSMRVIEGLMGERVKVTQLLANDLPLIRADASQLQQVLINLVVNARDAMPEGGEIKLATSLVDSMNRQVSAAAGLQGNFVRLRVQDSGHGVQEELKARIFEPFFTTKKGKQKGSGLGLSITFGIVKDHKGEIRLESSPGEGAIFDVLLPAVVDTGERTASGAKDWKPLTGSEVILLAEDQPAIRMLLKDCLERYGYTVVEASDGAEALEIAPSLGKLDLLITDLVMPRVGGLNLASELLKSQPDLKVIVISGYPDERDVWKKLKELGCEFLAKPFSPDSLARVVRNVLDKKRIHKS
jgi:two-component system cell cycle sensor histidine kinase/response regulator CckA